MASLLEEWIDVIPLGWAVVVTAAAIMLFEIIVLVMAISRRRSAPLSLKVLAIAGALVGAVPVAWWLPLQTARGMTIVAYSGHVADPSMTATWLSRGLDGQLFAILLAAVATLLVALPWFAGLAITLRTLRSEGRGRSVLPVVLIGAGLLPLAVGVIRWGISLNNALAVLAGVDPSMKRAVLEPPLTAARAELALSARVSTIAIAILAVLAAVSVVRRRRGGAGAPPSQGSARRSITLATAAVALAAWLAFAARPAVAEDELPWPPRTNWALFARQGPTTPEVVGPDAPDRAPLVEVFRDRVAVEGSGFRMRELEDRLGILHRNFTLLRPSEAFDGLALIQADRATPIANLASVLSALRGVKYDRPMLLFVAKNAQDRPVLGRLETSFVTGARFKIAYADDADGGDAGDWKNAVPLRLRDFAEYGAFARRLVELRAAGKPVLVKVERSDRWPDSEPPG